MKKLTIWLALAAVPAAAQDLERGRELFQRCSACHTLQPPGGADGPAQAGVVGRPSARLDDFRYSKAMARARLTWDGTMLDRYLAVPQALVPGTRMAFERLPQATDRAALIACLKSQHQGAGRRRCGW